MNMGQLLAHYEIGQIDAAESPASALMRYTPQELTAQIISLFKLDRREASVQRFEACDQLVLLLPRSHKLRRNASSHVVALILGGNPLVAFSPIRCDNDADSMKIFPQIFADVVQSFGLLRQPDLFAGVIDPVAVSDVARDNGIFQEFTPFYETGTGDIDCFSEGNEIWMFEHEEGSMRHMFSGVGQWFTHRFLDGPKGVASL